MNTQSNNALVASVNPYTQDYCSPDTFFTAQPNATANSAYDAAHSLLAQAHATVVALARDGEDLKEGFSLSQEIICNLLWAVDTQLGMVKAALAHMSEADQAASKVLGGVQ